MTLFNFHKETVLSHVRYHIAYAVNDDGVFMGTTQGPYILQLSMGPSYFGGGLTPLSLISCTESATVISSVSIVAVSKHVILCRQNLDPGRRMY